MKKNKILHIIPGLKMGGSETLLFNWLKCSINSNFHYEVLCFDPNGFYIKKLRDLGIKVHIVNLQPKNEMNILGLPKLLIKIQQINPDIIHSHCIRAHLWLFPALFLFLKLRGINPILIHTIHDTFKCINYQRRQTLEKFASLFISNQVAISNQVRDYHNKTFGVSLHKIEIIYNGINLNSFSAKSDNDFKKNIVTVANLHKVKKGYIPALNGIKLLVKKYPDLCYHIIGDGELRLEIENFIKKNNLKDNIKMHGQIDNVNEVLQNMDIFLLPSLWEGFGLVLVEAMAIGLPIVATNVGGIPEVLDYGNYGIIIKPNDFTEIEKAIAILIEDTELRQKLSQKGIERSKVFNIEKMIEKYEQCYSCNLKK